MFDISAYLPFEVYVVGCVIVLAVIASWNETKEDKS